MSRLVFKLAIEQRDDGSMIVATAERCGEYFEGEGNLLSVALENLTGSLEEGGVEDMLAEGIDDIDGEVE